MLTRRLTGRKQLRRLTLTLAILKKQILKIESPEKCQGALWLIGKAKVILSKIGFRVIRINDIRFKKRNPEIQKGFNESGERKKSF